MNTEASMETPDLDWWRHGVVYQVYVRSFADGDGDGTGDIAGLRSKLSYLRELGVDALWINPWYSSPLKDGGYDVADYRAIDERFGTIDEVEGFGDDETEDGVAEKFQPLVVVAAGAAVGQRAFEILRVAESVAQLPMTPATRIRQRMTSTAVSNSATRNRLPR